MSSLLEAALEYAEAGFAVFPCKPNSKEPLGGQGVLDASRNPEQIKKWWAQTPNANIGMAMGSLSGIVGLDIDFKDGARENFLDDLPPTIIQYTPSGGRHAFFKFPIDGIKNNTKLEQGVTIRASGYYFVVAPSVFNGNAYLWKGPRNLVDGEIAELPEWMKKSELRKINLQDEEVRIGHRHDDLVRIATALRKKGKDDAHILAALQKANAGFIDGPKSFDELAKVISWAKKNVFPEDKEEKAAKQKEFIQKQTDEVCDYLHNKFKRFSDSTRSIYYKVTNEEKKELEICTNEELVKEEIFSYLFQSTGNRANANIIDRIYKTWRIESDKLDLEPESFAWKSNDIWSFKRLEFDPISGKYPAWEEFTARLSSPHDFMAFVWSIFEPKNRSRQFLYLTDPAGEGGKSTVIRVLGSVFGNSFSSLTNSIVTGGGGRWLMGQIYGKRLVAWADCKNPKICMSEMIRNITSGDPVTIEFKGELPFSTNMYVKLIIGSNHEPEITSAGADTSRLINITVAENTDKKDDPEWESRLLKELPMFLYDCRSLYNEKCHAHGKIKLEAISHEIVETASNNIEDKYHEIFERCFVISESETVSAKDFLDVCRKENLTDREIGNFKEFLVRVYKIKQTRPRQGNRARCYLGVRVNLLHSNNMVF